MTELNTNSKFTWLSIKNVLFLFCLLSFILVAYRAHILSFTHDEALSYKVAFGSEVYAKTANNHYLNTYLMRVSFDFFGDSQFAFRLPNVLSYILYLFVWFNFLARTQNWFLAIFGAAIVLLNPFVLDYFSLARGYGLSLAFIMGSVYFLVKKTETIASFNFAAFGALGFAILAMYSSFATMNFFIATIALLLLKFVINYRKFTLTRAQVLLTVLMIVGSFVAFWFAYERLSFLQERKELYFGADNIRLSLNSLFLSTTTLIVELGNELKLIGYGFVLFLIIIVFLGKFKTTSSQLSLVLLLIIIGHLLEVQFFDALYPVERVVIYIFPLINLVLVFFLIEFFEKPRFVILKKLTSAVLVLMTFLLSYNFTKSFTLSATKTWNYDQHTQYVTEYLQSKATVNERITVSNHWLFEPSLYYYFASRELNISAATMEVNDSSDYVYTYSNEIDMRKYKTIVEFKELKLGLYKRIKS